MFGRIKNHFSKFYEKKMLGFSFLSNLKTLIFSKKKYKKKTIKNRKNPFFSHNFKNKRSQSWKRLTISKENTLSIGFGPNFFFFASSDLWTRFWFFPKTTQDTFLFFIFFLIFFFQFFFFRVCAGLRDEHINSIILGSSAFLSEKKKNHKNTEKNDSEKLIFRFSATISKKNIHNLFVNLPISKENTLSIGIGPNFCSFF